MGDVQFEFLDPCISFGVAWRAPAEPGALMRESANSIMKL
jgi:hypothetical protein